MSQKELDAALAKLNKQFGEGAVMVLGSAKRVPVEVISTGSILIDAALGVGGLPRKRVTEIFGPESTGKTTIALQVIAQAQKMGGRGAIVDAEHGLDRDYAEKLGVDVKTLIIAQPMCGEEALEITDGLVRSNAVDVIVVDSVAALVPRAELEGEMGDSFMGLQPRLMSQALRKLTGVVAKSNCCLIFINQIREKMGAMSYGPTETTTGGRALRYYSSVRMDVRRVQAIKSGEEVIGALTKIKIVKNKVASPAKIAEVDLIYGRGICKFSELVELGVTHKFLLKSGSWFSTETQKNLANGKPAMVEYLQSNKPFSEKLEADIRSKL